MTIDGLVVGTFNAVKGPSYVGLTTSAVTMPAGNHIIAFQGMNQTGDNTMFIDGVTVVPV